MPDKPVYVLGINAYDHDVSACLLRDGEIAYCILKERITREKHDSGFYDEVVEYCLEAEGITLDDVELIVRNCYVMPVEDMEDRFAYEDVPEFISPKERVQAKKNPLHRGSSPKVMTLSHHMAHAYSAFAASPFEEGAVMVVDGVGSYACDIKEPGQLVKDVNPLARESESYYSFKGTKLKPLKKVWLNPVRGFLSDEFFFMEGLGAIYSKVASYIFGDWNKCGEVMGLAPYGRPNKIAPLITIDKDGELTVPKWTAEKFNKPWMPDEKGDWEESPFVQHWKDMAWQMQDDAETVLLARANWLRKKTGAKNLTIAGGVGLNCVANGRIARECGYENVWIQPATGDDGIAIGCALYGYLEILKKPRKFVMKHAFVGQTYPQEEIDEALTTGIARFEIKRKTCDDICAETAKLLTEGHVFGWFQGGSEFGPRALGNRSIIADPRTPEMKDKVNGRVKHRQAFRPFAPIVLEERAHEIFEDDHDSPFMLMAKMVKPEWKEKIAAIVHVDGTARVQTVSKEDNPILHQLISEFDKLTGVPVLLNTSFNVKGEPIVETPEDALNCFLSTGFDRLVIHNELIEKSAMHKVISPAMEIVNDMRDMISTGLAANKRDAD